MQLFKEGMNFHEVYRAFTPRKLNKLDFANPDVREVIEIMASLPPRLRGLGGQDVVTLLTLIDLAQRVNCTSDWLLAQELGLSKHTVCHRIGDMYIRTPYQDRLALVSSFQGALAERRERAILRRFNISSQVSELSA